MEDAAGFFANVFGGERFKDWVSHLPCHPKSHRLPSQKDWRDISHERDDFRGEHNDNRRGKDRDGERVEWWSNSRQRRLLPPAGCPTRTPDALFAHPALCTQLANPDTRPPCATRRSDELEFPAATHTRRRRPYISKFKERTGPEEAFEDEP